MNEQQKKLSPSYFSIDVSGEDVNHKGIFYYEEAGEKARLGQYKEAIECYKKALKHPINYDLNASIYLRIAIQNMYLDNCDEALQYFSKALHAPISTELRAEIHFNRGRAYISMYEFTYARKDCDRAIELSKNPKLIDDANLNKTGIRTLKENIRRKNLYNMDNFYSMRDY